LGPLNLLAVPAFVHAPELGMKFSAVCAISLQPVADQMREFFVAWAVRRQRGMCFSGGFTPLEGITPSNPDFPVFKN
jgi:hypothetical protein